MSDLRGLSRVAYLISASGLPDPRPGEGRPIVLFRGGISAWAAGKERGDGGGKGNGKGTETKAGKWETGESGQNVFRPSWVQAYSATAGLKRVPF